MRDLMLILCLSGLGACSCQRQTPENPARAEAADDNAGISATIAADVNAAAGLARAARLDQQRGRAEADAVDTLHGYLRELGSGQRDAAEKRWAYQRSPTVGEESGLRSLTNLQAFRINNGAPRLLDEEPVPAYLEIPVDLRATLADGQAQRYKGWYRLRHNPVTTRWELTAASVSPVLR